MACLQMNFVFVHAFPWCWSVIHFETWPIRIPRLRAPIDDQEVCAARGGARPINDANSNKVGSSVAFGSTPSRSKKTHRLSTSFFKASVSKSFFITLRNAFRMSKSLHPSALHRHTPTVKHDGVFPCKCASSSSILGHSSWCIVWHRESKSAAKASPSLESAVFFHCRFTN